MSRATGRTFLSVGAASRQRRPVELGFQGALFQRSPLDNPQREGMTAKQKEIFDRVIGQRDTSKLARARQWWKDNKGQRALSLRQGYIDSFAPSEKIERSQHEGKLQNAEQSATKAAHLTNHTDKLFGHLLKNGMLKIETDENGDITWFNNDETWTEGGLEEIFRPVAEKGQIDSLQLYLAANRAQRLIQEGKERLMSEEDIAEGLALGDQNPDFKTALDKWQRFNAKMLDMSEAAGLINAEQRAVWEKNDYVPFYRLNDEADGNVMGGGQADGIEGQRSGIRTLKGGEQQLNDIIENIAMNVSSTIDRAAKNLAMRKQWAMMLDAGVLSPTATGWRPVSVPPEQAASKLREIGVDVDSLSPAEREHMLTFYQPAPPKGEGVVSVMIDGKPVWGRVDDPLMYQAISSMGERGMSNLMKVLNLAKRTLTTGVTATPEFMLANSFRDTLAAYVGTGQKGFIPVYSTLKGFVQALRNDQSLQTMTAIGAATGGFYNTQPSDVRKQINANLKGINKLTILNSPKKLWELWMKIGAATEQASRIGIFDAAKKEGVSDAEAAYRALDLLDFKRMGSNEAMRWLIQTVPFMNARIQGLDKVYRGAKDNPKRFLLRGSMVMAASMALLAQNWGDEDYEALEEWDKDTYYHFFLDDFVKGSDGQHLVFPSNKDARREIGDRKLEGVKPKKIKGGWAITGRSHFRLPKTFRDRSYIQHHTGTDCQGRAGQG